MKKFILLAAILISHLILQSQDISVQLVPDIGTIEDGMLAVCLGSEVTYTALVDYGNTDGTDANTLFKWTFTGNGADFIQGNSVRMASYDYPSGGTVSLEVIEQGTGSTANASLNVAVAGTPDLTNLFDDNPGSTLIGQSIDISASLEEGAPGYVEGFSSLFLTNGIEQNITFLPDGSGVSYETSIEITDAPPGSMLGETYFLESIWASLEHSYLGDLDIEVACPDETSILLQDQGGGSCNLGNPWATGPVDGQSANTTPGDGLIYYWSVSGESSLEDGCQDGVEFMSGDGPNTYTDSQVPSGHYSPSVLLTGLDGCPINGEWTITITDNIGADNGYVFCWGLEIEGYEFPNAGEYSTVVSSIVWSDDEFISENNGGSITVLPTESGQRIFDLTITDEHGCAHDVEYPLDVWDPNALTENSLDIELRVLQSDRVLTLQVLDGESRLLDLRLFDSSGKIVHSTVFIDDHILVAPSSGVYILELLDRFGRSHHRQIFID